MARTTLLAQTWKNPMEWIKIKANSLLITNKIRWIEWVLQWACTSLNHNLQVVQVLICIMIKGLNRIMVKICLIMVMVLINSLLHQCQDRHPICFNSLTVFLTWVAMPSLKTLLISLNKTLISSAFLVLRIALLKSHLVATNLAFP
jgi:hypothetical protein